MAIQLKRIFIVLLLMAAFIKVEADGLSYIYIQGDKQTPFYVKLEGEMQPRYGKNYCIIPKLAPGTVNIEILFQQNEFPPEKFTITVPENGFRGFMLIKKGDAFSLYDLQQAFYLPPGNSINDDVAPAFKQPVAAIEPVAAPVVVNTKPKTNPVTPPKTIKPKPAAVTKSKPVQPKPEPVVAENNEPKFINNIELNNERSFTNDSANQKTEPVVAANSNSAKADVMNSDCPKPMVRSDYESLLKKARNKSDNNRLKFLLEHTGECYSSIQVRALTRTLTKDAERYAFLKEVYPHVTDQSNFPMLESTLISKEWKEYFRLILPE